MARLIPDFPGKRWVKILSRSLHLVGIAGVFGAAIYQQPQGIFLWLAIASGLTLIVLEAGSNTLWFVQIRGLVTFLKLIMLVFLGVFSLFQVEILSGIIIVSGIISHAPSNVRYYSWYHKRVVKRLGDIKG